jgi:hypothetical protein
VFWLLTCTCKAPTFPSHCLYGRVGAQHARGVQLTWSAAHSSREGPAVGSQSSVQDLDGEATTEQETQNICIQRWWYTPVIPALRRPRQEECTFDATLGYILRWCLQANNKRPTALCCSSSAHCISILWKCSNQKKQHHDVLACQP